MFDDALPDASSHEHHISVEKWFDRLLDNTPSQKAQSTQCTHAQHRLITCLAFFVLADVQLELAPCRSWDLWDAIVNCCPIYHLHLLTVLTTRFHSMTAVRPCCLPTLSGPEP
jgi:hypothetical protein